MVSLLLFLWHREMSRPNRENLLRFFLLLLFSFGVSPDGWTQEPSDSVNPVEEAVEGEEEEVIDTAAPLELTEEEIVALIEKRRAKRRALRARRNSYVGRDLSRELLAVAGLLVLLLLTRKHNRDQESLRPTRVSPVSPDELGRVLFSFIHSKDTLAFRALFLTGGEARELFGEAGVGVYLEGRSANKLESALKDLAAKVPIGAQYQSCIIQEEICRLQLKTSDGQDLDLAVARVALIGAVIRLVSPIEE
jgi:hypothetical protein